MNQQTKSWLWPDRTIGRGESRILREEHNALVNSHAEALDALRGMVGLVQLIQSTESPAQKHLVMSNHRFIEAMRVIAKAENPNAETVQSYPDRENALAELLALRDRAKAFLACADPNGPWSQDEREGLAYLRQAVHAIEKDTV